MKTAISILFLFITLVSCQVPVNEIIPKGTSKGAKVASAPGTNYYGDYLAGVFINGRNRFRLYSATVNGYYYDVNYPAQLTACDGYNQITFNQAGWGDTENGTMVIDNFCGSYNYEQLYDEYYRYRIGYLNRPVPGETISYEAFSSSYVVVHRQNGLIRTYQMSVNDSDHFTLTHQGSGGTATYYYERL